MSIRREPTVSRMGKASAVRGRPKPRLPGVVDYCDTPGMLACGLGKAERSKEARKIIAKLETAPLFLYPCKNVDVWIDRTKPGRRCIPFASTLQFFGLNIAI